MPSIFSRLKGKDSSRKSKKNGAANGLAGNLSQKPRWDDAYTRKTVDPEEIQELVTLCTAELKARGLDIPFLLLPFRPTSDPSAVRTFVRHFFDSNPSMSGEALLQELRMTEPMVISGVIKWCWSRLQGGIVGWDAYELFKIGEQDSNEALDSFKTFIPISVDNEARTSIIFAFFDLLSAIAAHGKANGFGGRKLSRMASWWAFESRDTGNGMGFEGGYKEWLKAADATSHLFFAYLRSLSPTQGLGSFASLPMSLQKLLQETEYPPQTPSLLQSSTNKVVMIVETVSPTPFALLRRGRHFEYRDEDRALREFSDYEDPVQALTDECRRVLKAISAANQTQAVSSSKHSTSLRDASWSRFEDIGFGSLIEEEDDDDLGLHLPSKRNIGLRTTPASGGDGLDRPTTPSWADFLSSGFVDDGPNSPTNMLLPPDKVLPPIEANIRQRSSQSHRPRLETEFTLEPGELASISRFDLDDSFWWVWMASLAPEETPERKSAFGRCTVIETRIKTGRWLVMEEIVKGAAAEPNPGAYIAEKKGFFSWTRRNKGVSRSKSTGKQALRGQGLLGANGNDNSTSKTSIAPDQQAKIQAAAQRLQARQKENARGNDTSPGRRGRSDASTEKTNSVFTLQPVIASEASSALKWASKYDKEAIREAYLSNSNAGRGQATMSSPNVHLNGMPSTVNEMTGALEKPAAQVPEKKESALKAPEKAPETPAKSKPSAEASALAAVSEKVSPSVPPKDAPKDKSSKPVAPARDSAASSTLSVPPSPDGKKGSNKLHKEDKEEKKTGMPPSASTTGGFRKLFNRKNRHSKLPDNAAAEVNTMLAADAKPAQAPASAVVSEAPVEKVVKTAAVAPAAAVPTPEPVPAPVAAPAALPKEKADIPIVSSEPAYEASVDTLSRVGTAEAKEADSEFSRFDQGPLDDQPAFVPEDSSSTEDDAVPPPIARERSPVSPTRPSAIPIGEATQPDVPPAIDRWAQIRKNAADRAAKRQVEEPPAKTYTKTTTDGDDDTSGEETIESRVARIRARVAELTGNMEGVSGPGTRVTSPPVRH